MYQLFDPDCVHGAIDAVGTGCASIVQPRGARGALALYDMLPASWRGQLRAR